MSLSPEIESRELSVTHPPFVVISLSREVITKGGCVILSNGLWPSQHPYNVLTLFVYFRIFYKFKTLSNVAKVPYAVDGTFWPLFKCFFCVDLGVFYYFRPFTRHPHSPLTRFCLLQKNAVVTYISSSTSKLRK